MSDHKYVTMENVLEADDWGLIINENGDLKGLYIPAGKDDSEVQLQYKQFAKSTLALTGCTKMYLTKESPYTNTGEIWK